MKKEEKKIIIKVTLYLLFIALAWGIVVGQLTGIGVIRGIIIGLIATLVWGLIIVIIRLTPTDKQNAVADKPLAKKVEE